jgi:hypothetical protein
VRIKTSIKQFAAPWARLCAAHPRHEISAATLTIYHERLCRYDVKTITAAVNRAIDECQFFPAIAELLRIVERLPPSSLKRLDEPRPTPEQVEKNRKAINEMIERLANEKKI